MGTSRSYPAPRNFTQYDEPPPAPAAGPRLSGCPSCREASVNLVRGANRVARYACVVCDPPPVVPAARGYVRGITGLVRLRGAGH